MHIKQIREYVTAALVVFAAVQSGNAETVTFAQCKKTKLNLDRLACFDALAEQTVRPANLACELEVTKEDILMFFDPTPFGSGIDFAAPAVYPVLHTHQYQHGRLKSAFKFWFFEIENGKRSGWVLYDPLAMEATGADCPL